MSVRHSGNDFGQFHHEVQPKSIQHLSHYPCQWLKNADWAGSTRKFEEQLLVRTFLKRLVGSIAIRPFAEHWERAPLLCRVQAQGHRLDHHKRITLQNYRLLKCSCSFENSSNNQWHESDWPHRLLRQLASAPEECHFEALPCILVPPNGLKRKGSGKVAANCGNCPWIDKLCHWCIVSQNNGLAQTCSLEAYQFGIYACRSSFPNELVEPLQFI